jgi:multiple sugar transport system permease protein
MSLTAVKESVVSASPVGSPRKGLLPRRGLLNSQRRAGWWMALPTTVHLLIFIAIPALVSLWLSFFDYGFFSAPRFIGADNYFHLANDPRFATAMLNTVVFTAVVVPVSMAIALAVALGLNQKIKGRAFFRIAFFLPQVTATLAIAIVWSSVFNPDTGPLAVLLSFFGLGRVPWLSSPDLALTAIIIMSIWQAIGLKVILYIAGLQNLPEEVLEAAEIDGTSPWQRFRYIVLPMLSPTHVFVVITSIIGSFQVFDQVYAMTKGGPIYSSTVITYEIYLNAFERFKFGYACAEAVVLFLLIAGVLLLGKLARKLWEASRER